MPLSSSMLFAFLLTACSDRAPVLVDQTDAGPPDTDAGGAIPDAGVDAGTECRPGIAFCRAGEVATCGPDGRVESMTPCEGGTVCAGGRCLSPCDAMALGSTYEGCTFRMTAPPAMMSGHGGPRIPELGVGLHNAGDVAAMVSISGGSLGAAENVILAPASSMFVTVPLIAGVFDRAVYGVSATVLARDTATYRVSSNVPIVAYQFSPEVGLEYNESRFLMKADASVLFPTHVWGTEYIVATMRPLCGTFACGPDSETFAQITADTDGTMIEVDVTTATQASVEGTVTSSTVTEDPVAAVAAGEQLRVTLDAGDLLQLTALGDLTGTKITASQPVQLLSGNVGVRLDDRFTALGDGHLHEAMLPASSWGRSYVAVPPPHPTRSEVLSYDLRIVAGQSAATVTLDPPMGGPLSIPPRGSHDLRGLTTPVRITSDQPILALAMSSPSDVPVGDGIEQVVGAASMVALPPIEQWREAYGFSVPPSFDYAHVIAIVPMTGSVTVDGMTVTGATPIGTTGLGYLHIAITASSPAHSASGTAPFALLVYGQADGSSYWYAAGLDADTLI
jgi:hypothetical protein